MLSTSTNKWGIAVTSILVALALLFIQASAFAATTIVTGNTSAGENQPGWLFNRDASTATPFTFNTAAASIGTGSLYVLPIGANAADKFIGENFINAPISDIDSISYDFKIGSGGDASDAGQFYMNVYANFGVSPDDKFYDCRYNVVPTTGSTAGFTTVTFDPTQSYDVTTSGTSPFVCPAIPAEMDLQSATSTIRVFAINVGDTSTSDVGLDGYLDNVVVVQNAASTVSDFEAPAPVLAAEDFGVVNYDTGLGILKGYTAGFGLSNGTLAGAQSVVVQLYSGATLLQTNTAIIPKFNADITGTQFSSPFDVSGTFDYVTDGYWTNVREAQYGQSVPATRVVATVTLSDGTVVTAENTLLTGDPTTIYPPAPPVPTAKDDCKDGGWKTFTNPSFKNQGQCVSEMAKQQ